MPIIDLQRRLREIGRIRIGEQVPIGNGKTRPAKLANFRLTSRDRLVVDAAAARYGGTTEKWDAPDGPQWEVKTTSAELAVIVPPGDMAFSQFYEQWTAGGCKVRCDGQFDHVGDRACHCDPEARACAIHTRLSVMLPDLPGVGVWRLDSQGYYAAVELGGLVDLSARYSVSGAMIPARLRLEQRSVKRPKRDGSGVQTLRYAVPVLDLDIHPLALTGTGGAVAALRAPAAFTPVPETVPERPAPSVAEQVAAIDDPPERPPRANAQAPIPATGKPPRTAAEATTEPVGPVCDRRGSTLVGHPVQIESGVGRVHRDGCPTLKDAPTPPLPLDDPPPPEGPREVPSAVNAADLAKRATKVFRAAYDAAPKGDKSKAVDRCRHALTHALFGIGGQSWAELSPEQLHRVSMELGHLERDEYQWELVDGGIVFTLNDLERCVEWNEIEPT